MKICLTLPPPSKRVKLSCCKFYIYISNFANENNCIIGAKAAQSKCNKNIQVGIRFENLFNNIPIDCLYNVLKNIFYLFYIQYELYINSESSLCLCRFCFYNNYVIFNNRTLRWLCGIYMGTNYSSTVAYFFLFY